MSRLIIEYANQTADQAYEITIEAKRCLEGEDTLLLHRMLDKKLHRKFDGKINKPLQQAIAGCNEGLDKISKALNQTDYHTPLFIASNEMPDRLLNIWNAITEYQRIESKKQKRELKVVNFISVIVVIICIALILNDYGYFVLLKNKVLGFIHLIQN